MYKNKDTMGKSTDIQDDDYDIVDAQQIISMRNYILRLENPSKG